MSLLIGMFLMTAMVSSYNVAAFALNDFENDEENDYLSLKHLRQLVRELKWDDDEELLFNERADPEGDCTAHIIEGYQYNGVQSFGVAGVDTVQGCMDTCDINGKCIGWSYAAYNQNCWGFSSITGVIKDPTIKSGSCIGPSIKTTCTEQKKGQYSAIVDQTLEQVATVQDCMARCDQSEICFGWLYSSNDQKCYLDRDVGTFSPDDYFITGSCLAPQIRHLLADPLIIFRKQALKRHNEKRKDHCSPDLALDTNLNKISQDLAIQLATDDLTPPVFQATQMQNVYFNPADYDLTGAYPVDCFYDERKFYNWDNPDFSTTNHFPKVVWKSSTLLGIGRAFGSDNLTMYVVMTYDWQGDIATSYKDNVPKSCV